MRNLPETLPVTEKPQHQATGKNTRHESADKHVTGKAQFIDDIPEPVGCLHAYPVMATVTHGRILAIDTGSARAVPGVVTILSSDDIPGHKDIGPVFPGDLLLAEKEITFHGQPLLLVVAESHDIARKAAQLVKVDVEHYPATLDIKEAIQQKNWVRPPHSMGKGDALTALTQSERKISGEMTIGGQEHFYLEGQIGIATPTEDGGMMIHSSSQHPTEVQKLVAEVLDLPINLVTTQVRRMGGAFGGKETQAAAWACMAALAAYHTGYSVKVRLSRSDDFRLTGKRHPFYNTFTLGFDRTGLIEAADITVNGYCGISPDLSDAIVDRAMFHVDNAYYYPHTQVQGNRCKVNTVSHTAFRGFGGPQGMILAERMLDDIAYTVGKDPLDVRKLNLYRPGYTTTHYGQEVEQHILPELIEQLEHDSDYRNRRKAIDVFNKCSPIIKKGLALTPVKFGISFTVQHLNQAGALLHVYTDGSVQLNHGGTEMGQGLYTKVAQIVAEVLGISIEHIHCTATRTDKVPNTSPTAASSGTDLNGMAAFNAAMTIKQRLIDCLAQHHDVPAESIEFKDNRVRFAGGELSFGELAQLAYTQRVSLSCTGFYKTPKIHYDRATATGRPFFYYANGASVSEVEVDTLTGEYRVTRVDILHDVGRSLNPALDRGQIEGAFIQGMGWLTTEELLWDKEGQLASAGPATYKIPSIGDTPEMFNVDLFESANAEQTVFRSKAVGEPPFMLAFSVWSALRNAIASLCPAGDGQRCPVPSLDPPATPEKVLAAITAAIKVGAAQRVPQEEICHVE